MLYSQKPTKKRSIPKPWIIAAAVIGGLVLILLVLELTNTTHLLHKAPVTSGTIPSKIPAKVDPQTSDVSNNSTQTNSTSGSSDKTDTPPPANPDTTTLTEPTIASSTHSPSANSEAIIESQCITLPGATCRIEFTKDGVTKTLAEQTAGSTGALYWNWSTKDAGLDTGNWKVTAIAKLGSQTKSVTDQINFEVKP